MNQIRPMHLFHCPDLLSDTVELPVEEGHHAGSVLRLGVGARIGLVDGKGMRAEAELIDVSKKRVLAQVVERHVPGPERIARIHMAVAPTKQMDRYEWFVEKAVEVGVDRITPLITEHCERTKLRLDRLKRVAVSAMKQSQRTWLPEIDEPIRIGQFLEIELPTQRFFGWCEGEHTSLMRVYDPTHDCLIVIGPEGDLSPDEAEQLGKHEFMAISLGKARLRAETAALAACTWMSLTQQR